MPSKSKTIKNEDSRISLTYYLRPRFLNKLMPAFCLVSALVAPLGYSIAVASDAHRPMTGSDVTSKRKVKSGDMSYHSSKAKHNGMILIPAGTFWMGCDEPSLIDVRPWHQVHIDTFWLDKTTVTNKEFASFVHATGYKTVAERKPEAKDFPGAPPENLVPGALVFTPPSKPVSLRNHYQWWQYVHGANWQHPEGPASNLKGRWDHPVVQIAWEDAEAYANWAGKRLPTEAEFEYAARGGLNRKRYSWGDDLRPAGRWQANIWQGNFPCKNACEDGFATTAPVRSFAANAFGLYDMTGNVWQWCSDWYSSNYYQSLDNTKVLDNPKGPSPSLEARAHDTRKVQRGGSFLCTDQYCARYLVGARGKGETSSGCSNVGFRCATDIAQPAATSNNRHSYEVPSL